MLFGLLDKLTKKQQPVYAASATQINIGGNVIWLDINKMALINSFYTIPELYFVFHSVVSTRCAKIDYELCRQNKKGEFEPLDFNSSDQVEFRTLINNPNYYQDKRLFLEQVFDYNSALGTNYTYIKRSNNYNLRDAKMYNLPGQHVEILMRDQTYNSKFYENEIIGYRLNYGNISDFDPESVVVFKNSTIKFDNGQYLFGISDIEVCNERSTSIKENVKLRVAVGQNSGAKQIISGAPGANFPMTGKSNIKLSRLFEKNYGFGKDQVKTMFVNQPIQVHDLMSKFTPSATIPVTKDDKEIIALVGRVPLPFVSNESGTYNNRINAERELYTDCIIPKCDSFANTLTNGLGYDKRNIVVKPIIRNLSVLKSDKKIESDVSSKAWNDGVITKNQYLVSIGLEPVPDGNKYKSEYESNKIIQPAGLQG